MTRDDDGMTALHHAVLSTNIRTIKVLVGAGADKAITDSSGRTPLQVAVDAGRVKPVTALLED